MLLELTLEIILISSYFDEDQLGSSVVLLFNYLCNNDGGRGASRKRVKLGIDLAEKILKSSFLLDCSFKLRGNY